MQKADEEAAAVYNEFVESFAEGPQDRPGSRAFVRGEVIQPGKAASAAGQLQCSWASDCSPSPLRRCSMPRALLARPEPLLVHIETLGPRLLVKHEAGSDRHLQINLTVAPSLSLMQSHGCVSMLQGPDCCDLSAIDCPELSPCLPLSAGAPARTGTYVPKFLPPALAAAVSQGTPAAVNVEVSARSHFWQAAQCIAHHTLPCPTLSPVLLSCCHKMT